jgi:hypothetical protein
MKKILFILITLPALILAGCAMSGGMDSGMKHEEMMEEEKMNPGMKHEEMMEEEKMDPGMKHEEMMEEEKMNPDKM